jgi:hypothetical protein
MDSGNRSFVKGGPYFEGIFVIAGEARFRQFKKVFLNPSNKPPLEVLVQLNRLFQIGGAIPYLAIRKPESGREAMIVVRCTETGEEMSTRVLASGMTEDRARNDPAAKKELEEFARERLLKLQAKHAPETIRYSTILRWWLDRRKGTSLTPYQLKVRKRHNLEAGRRDPSIDADADQRHVEEWLDFLQGRTLESHHFLIHEDFAKWRRERLIAAGKKLRNGQPVGGADATIAGYEDCLRLALNDFAKVFNPPIRLAFGRTKVTVDDEQRAADGITWPVIQRLILFCLGYIWNEDGFAWDWVDKDGKKIRRWLRLSGEELAGHLLYYMPVLRVVLIYFVTATRLDRILWLGWKPDDSRGWIDFARRMIIRNGRKGPNYKAKPRRPSRLTRPALKLFELFLNEDTRARLAGEWDDGDKNFFIVHDGHGNKAKNMARRLKKAFAAVGLESRRHDLKAACIAVFFEAGYDLRRAARLAGNDPNTVEKRYLFLTADAEGTVRPNPNPKTLTFLQFADPQKLCRRRPRASRPGLPPAPTAE